MYRLMLLLSIFLALLLVGCAQKKVKEPETMTVDGKSVDVLEELDETEKLTEDEQKEDTQVIDSTVKKKKLI